jgi:hypothetical protein
MALIYIFDNNTGVDLPNKVDVYPVEILLGSNVSEIKGSVPSSAKIFCVFTHLKDCDFVVSNAEDANRLKDILDFGKLDYTIGVKPTSMWYSSAKINLIISDSVNINQNQIAMIISSMIGITNIDGTINKTTIAKEMYLIFNIRNSKVLFRTPKYTEAVKICDQNPCCVIKQKSNGEIIYKSMYGRVSIPTKSETQISKYKARMHQQNLFNIKGL